MFSSRLLNLLDNINKPLVNVAIVFCNLCKSDNTAISPKSHGVLTCDSLLTNHFFPHKTLSTTSQQQKRHVFSTENPDVYKLTSHQTKCSGYQTPFFPQFQHPNPSNQLTMDWYWPSFNLRSSRFEGLLGLLGDLVWNTWMPGFSRRTGFQSQGGKR